MGGVVAALALAPGAAIPAEYSVHLVSENESGRFRFEPAVVYAEVGDTVRFIPDDGMHAAKSVPGMLPVGASPWRGGMGETISVHLEEPGVYGVKCRSGYEVGMVGLIVVGSDPPNWDQARAVRHPPRPSAEFALLFDEAGCKLHRSPCPQ
ncbi:MAG: plastocyanin/azurin family copper-binding protein [Geminicoccaceae bacterium]